MFQLGELADLIGARLVGDPGLPILGAASMARATADDITFVSSDRFLDEFLDSDAYATIIASDVNFQCADRGKSFLIVDDPHAAFAKVVQQFRPMRERSRIGVSSGATVSSTARIAEDVDIYPGAFVGENVSIGCGSIIYPQVTLLDNVAIGANTTVFPGATIYENCVVGDRCLIHAGAVIGGFGFGYKSDERHQLSPQMGNVEIGNDVEIGCNTTIDRGTWDATTVGDGSKLDNQVMIGHNCQIGKHNLLCAQVGIAGSSRTGDYVVMAGQVGIGDHLKIGSRTTLAAQSGVMSDLAGDQVYLGSPAMAAREQMQIHAVVAKLPELRKRLRNVERELKSDLDAQTERLDAA